ncbi:MAG TPA: FAD-dependent oxidoreductase [Propionibacteriaceae bacterium]|nr:FAD-dependent oxidoreductase [Propionibacteriaceae bacterium]
MKKLIILGGGTAGTMSANKLRSEVPASQLEITVIDRDDSHHYQPGYLFMPFGTYTVKDVVKSRHSYIHEGINLIISEIAGVDADARTVELADGRELPYDYLIIATGTHPRPDMVEGLPENLGKTAHEFYTLEGAQALTAAMKKFKRGRLLVHVAEMPIKCPVAPLEFTFLADDFLRKNGRRSKIELVYVTPLDGAFTKPVASRELGTALSDRHIALETDFAIERVEADKIVSFDGRELAFDLLVTVPPNLGAEFLATSGLGDDMNYVPCDQQTMESLEYPGSIWVLGDAGTLKTSKAGAVAHFSVEIFIENFVNMLKGQPQHAKFDGHANCFIESGNGKGMLLDFNYDTEPFTGTFPFPKVGPMSLLKESRVNHLSKLAFKWVYWNMLLPGRKIPLPPDMSLRGKIVETGVGSASDAMPTGAPAASPTRPAPPRKGAPPHKSIKLRPAPKTPAPSAKAEFKPVIPVHTGPATNSTAPADQVLVSPIIPKF